MRELDIHGEILAVPLGDGVNLSARLLYIDTVGRALRNSPSMISSIFTPEEISYCMRYRVRSDEHFAARLAAKQIVTEQLSNGTVKWSEVSVRNNDYKSPYFEFSDNARTLLDESGIQTAHVSLAHEDNIAVACCALEQGDYTRLTRIVRIGTDVCFDTPFKSTIIQRTTTFTKEEVEVAKRKEDPARRYAMYFAAKESVVKILEILSGWRSWQEIQVHEAEKEEFYITLSGSAKERLEQIGASEIVTSLSYREEFGALAFSAALTYARD